MDKEEAKRILEKDAIRARDTNVPSSVEPLTLEQLREMDGMPAFGVSLINGKPGKWFIVRIVEVSKNWFIACNSASRGFGDKDTYGESWLAYPYPPARIDQEKWTAEWEWFDEYIGNPLDGIERDWGWRCSKCGYILPDDFDDPDSPPKMEYCSVCGRAMTPEAWEKLEARLMHKCPISESLESCEDCGLEGDA